MWRSKVNYHTVTPKAHNFVVTLGIVTRSSFSDIFVASCERKSSTTWARGRPKISFIVWRKGETKKRRGETEGGREGRRREGERGRRREGGRGGDGGRETGREGGREGGERREREK